MQSSGRFSSLLALPTMAVGFNQALMFAFFMTMIAAFIGTIDVGQELQKDAGWHRFGQELRPWYQRVFDGADLRYDHHAVV